MYKNNVASNRLLLKTAIISAIMTFNIPIANTATAENSVHGENTAILKDAVAYWPLDGNADDASGNGHNGTIHGTQTTKGILGQSLAFDGHSKILFGRGPALNGKTDFTISVWVKTTTQAKGAIIQQRNGGYNGEYQLYVNNNGTVGLMLYGNGAYQFKALTTADTVNDDKWHHIVFTRQGAKGTIYLDGTMDVSATGPVKDLKSSIAVGMGADIRDRNEYLTGQIDEVAIWSRALSQKEVKTIFNTLNSRNITTVSTVPQCFWMENISGQFNWIPANIVYNKELTKQECFELDSCDGGLGKSGGGCYMWANSIKAKRIAW